MDSLVNKSVKYKDISFGEIKLDGGSPFLIAEAGVNYENDIKVALKMVEEASRAGADAIKFQSYKAESLASKYSPSYWDLTKEPTTSQYELFKKYDSFGDKEYKLLAEKAKECGIIFMSTPFDSHFVDSLDELMPLYKIASADITNYPLIRQCAKKGKPILLSIGASTMAEVEKAIEIIENEGNSNIALLHCVLAYPTKPEDANLSIIETLIEKFPQYVIGYSDHVPPHQDCLALTTAWLLGARIIEKHFTLDKTKIGNDHYHAMDPEDLRKFREQCDLATTFIGENKKRVLPCETGARKHARRSLVASRTLKAGEIIQEEDILIKRPATGIHPKHFDLAVGKIVVKQIFEDEILQWEMFEKTVPSK